MALRADEDILHPKTLPFRGVFAYRKAGIPTNNLGGIYLHLKGWSEIAFVTNSPEEVIPLGF